MFKLATFSGITPEGEPLNRVFHPGDSVTKVAGTMMPQIQEWLNSYQKEPGKIAVLVNALGASEYWGQNINGDIFPENALVHDCRNHAGHQHPYDDFTGKIIPAYGYPTFLDAHPFVHHRNKDPNRAFGKVVLSVWNPRMHRVELVIIIDKALALQHGAQHVVDRILAGEFPDCSMGCKVPYDICSCCGHKSKTRHDYCVCITQFGMGKLLDDGRRVGVINTYPRFFDISFVFIGADKTAKVMCKLASGLYVPASVLEGEEIYGFDFEEELVKAASIQVPSNIYWSHDSKTAEPRIAGVSMAESDRILSKGPSPQVLYGKTDAQLPETKRAIEDGALNTNNSVNESEEDKEQPLYPGLGKVSSRGGYKLLSRIKGAKGVAKKISTSSATQTAAVESTKEKKGNSRRGQVMEFYLAKGKLPKLWAKTKRMRFGPPPKPNRKEYPFTGTLDFRGLMIHIENLPGSVREGKGWKTNMKMAYGEFLGTRGVDKDKLDVYVGPYRQAPNVYIVHQNFAFGPKKGKYDEDKVMVGFESAEQAKQAYLAHYNSPKFFRSITTMAFPIFKRAIMKKEVHGEKVATELEKVAADMKLEDLFDTPNAQRRKKLWRDKVSGRETRTTSSGFESMDEAKTASAQKGVEDLFGVKTSSTIKIAAPSPRELLKLSDRDKWADIVKEIGPDKAVGKVSPLLSDSEPCLPRETLNELGSAGMESGLSTPSMAGMVLKPKEFQRIMLVSMGKGELADNLDGAGAEFAPSDKCESPCRGLGPGLMDMQLLRKILPMLSRKSYFGPPVRSRIIRVTISKPDEGSQPIEMNSPLLSKVSSAYNWYRREQIKLAADAPIMVSSIPELHAGIYGLGDSDLFKKSAAKGKVVFNPKTIGVILGSIPLTLMYSAHLRDKQRSGDDMGMLDNLIANHPWLSTMGTAAALKKVMDTPQAQQAADEMLSAAGRIWRGKGAPQAAL